jgi:hypothetical protein
MKERGTRNEMHVSFELTARVSFARSAAAEKCIAHNNHTVFKAWQIGKIWHMIGHKFGRMT